VADAKGDEVSVHEYEEREFLTKKHRFSLETGEIVVYNDEKSFVVAQTGERLTRVE
jgi:hypothetical protein